MNDWLQAGLTVVGFVAVVLYISWSVRAQDRYNRRCNLCGRPHFEHAPSCPNGAPS